MKFYVYVYRDPSRKNEPIYVGKGQDDRAYEHLKRAKNNHFKNRLAKMKREGVEPIINVVDLPSEALAFQCEIDTIARLGRRDLKLGPLLNQTDGGEGVSNPSPETRKKQSDAKKGKSPSAEARKNMSDAQKGENNSMYGKSHTEAANQKNSDAHRGKPSPNKGKSPSADTRAKMSEAKKGIPRPRVTCPHCRKEGGGGSMKQWHFDNCKYKKHQEE